MQKVGQQAEYTKHLGIKPNGRRRDRKPAPLFVILNVENYGG